MKPLLILAPAIAALMLAACTSRDKQPEPTAEETVVVNTAQTPEVRYYVVADT